MAREQGGKEASAPSAGSGLARRPYNLLDSLALRDPGGLGEHADRPDRLRRQLPGRGGQELGGCADRLRLDGRRGRTLLGRHRQRDLPDDRQQAVRRPADAATRSALGGRPTSGRCSRRWGCLPRAPGFRSPMASTNSSTRSRPATSPSATSCWRCRSCWRHSRPCSPCARPPRPSPAAGPDRACAGHLRSHPAGRVRGGLRRADRVDHRGHRAGGPPDHRFAGSGRRPDRSWSARCSPLSRST